MPNITGLKWLNAREVLGGEASHFTPWLAENIELLADALGLTDISDVRTESPVMSKAVDILATGTDSDGRELAVVIENQYGETDHKHLGQLITYLAPHDRGYAVWVTEDYSPAHVAAIEFLNRTSSEDFGYFLVQVRFAEGRDDSYQVYFELVSRPNAFVKRSTSRRKGQATAPVNESRRSYLASVLAAARSQFEALGYSSVRMHTRGSYIEMRLPIASLDAWGARFKVYANKTETTVRLHLASDNAEANYAALELIRKQYGNEWSERLADLGEIEWHASPGAESDCVRMVLPGVGYNGGSVEQSAAWALRIAEAWLKPMKGNPIMDLEAEVQTYMDEQNSGSDEA